MERAGADILIRLSRRAALAVAVLAALALGACSRHGKEQESPSVSPDSLPPPALTDRAQRDSARVAEVFLAYYRFMAKHDTASVRRLFYPESILVGRPDGSYDVEGQGAALLLRIADPKVKEHPVRRILLLRRVEQELLEQTYREIWMARFVPDRPDSAPVELKFHVIEPLGRDTRWLGSIPPG
jgi:hypothetical protein